MEDGTKNIGNKKLKALAGMLALFVVMLAVLDVMLYVGDKKPVMGFCVALGVLFCATVVYGHKVVAKYVGHGWTAMYEIVMAVSIVVFACCSIGCV